MRMNGSGWRRRRKRNPEERMRISSIIHYLEELAPLDLQEEYDNSGLLIGNSEQDVQGVLICLDCTEEVMDEAIRKGCNLVIAHHPVIFKGLKRITGRTDPERVVEKALMHRIAVYAIHTNLDNVFAGVNKILCEKLGLIKCSILLPGTRKGPDDSIAGAGMIGTLREPMTEKAFLRHIKKALKAGMIRHTPLLGRKISKVAVCGGSGSFLLREALRRQADVFISADFKYHQFFEAEKKLIIADVGHYESEQFTKELLYNRLMKKFSIFAPRFEKGAKKIPLLVSAVNTNPINYL